MRFQDAARDARAVVYAGIQADPQVARTAALLADATPAQRLLARAVMNGETTDPAGWRTMFPSLFGPSATGDAAEVARSEAILEASLAVADRGEQVRSQVRGALIEEVTAQLLARRVGPDAVRRERRILFDGVPAEIHPYDVTVERERVRRGVRLQMGCPRHQRRRPAPARRRADARGRRGRAARRRPGRVRRTAIVRRPARPADRAARRDRPRLARDARRPGRAAPMSARAPDSCSAPYRVRFDEGGPDGLIRTSVLLRYTQDLAGYHSSSRGFGRSWYAERGITWLVRAAEVVGRRHRSRSGRNWSARPRSSAGVASGPAAGPSSTTPTA